MERITYGKIFEQIYDSSIAEDWTVRLVFQDLIVLSDVNGVVDKTPEAISRRTNVPLEIVLKAIQQLEQPDAKSRSSEENGARIRRLDEHRDWGWEIVNYHKYREIASADQQREKTKLRTRKWRNSGAKPQCDAPVTLGDARDAMQMQKEMQKEREWETELPHNFPETIDDAVSQCMGFCPDIIFVTKLYNSAMSKHGKDGNGQPITSFRHYVAKHWPGEVSKRAEQKAKQKGNGQPNY